MGYIRVSWVEVTQGYARLCKDRKYTASQVFVLPQVVFRETRGGMEITNNQLWAKFEAANRTRSL
jgi:hypothetical protein